jgi:hypothetical protein
LLQIKQLFLVLQVTSATKHWQCSLASAVDETPELRIRQAVLVPVAVTDVLHQVIWLCIQ